VQLGDGDGDLFGTIKIPVETANTGGGFASIALGNV
jgi:hypothetical protein